LANFPQKNTKFVKFTMEKQNFQNFPNFWLKFWPKKRFTKIIGVKSLLQLQINVMFNHGIFLINFVVFGKKFIKEKKINFSWKKSRGHFTTLWKILCKICHLNKYFSHDNNVFLKWWFKSNKFALKIVGGYYMLDA